jgi:adenine/guanine phosphoribosyltransferase-like PRPP-binding protein
MVSPTPTDAHAIALMALAAAISDERRARRFLDLTGIGTEELRERAGDTEVLAAVIRFLEAYEPDLTAVAEAVGVAPAALVAARRKLEGKERG